MKGGKKRGRDLMRDGKEAGAVTGEGARAPASLDNVCGDMSAFSEPNATCVRVVTLAGRTVSLGSCAPATGSESESKRVALYSVARSWYGNDPRSDAHASAGKVDLDQGAHQRRRISRSSCGGATRSTRSPLVEARDPQVNSLATVSSDALLHAHVMRFGLERKRRAFAAKTRKMDSEASLRARGIVLVTPNAAPH